MESSENKIICKKCNYSNPEHEPMCKMCGDVLESPILTANVEEDPPLPPLPEQLSSGNPLPPPQSGQQLASASVNGQTDKQPSPGADEGPHVPPEPPKPGFQPPINGGRASGDGGVRLPAKPITVTIVSVILIGIVGYLIYPYLFLHHDSVPTSPTPMCTAYSIPANGIGVCLDDSVNGDEHKETIGLSDGSYALDVDNERPGSDEKRLGSNAFKNKQWDDADNHWKIALGKDTNDAEAAIYRENLRVLRSSYPYLTVVIGAVLADFPTVDYSSRDQLQGAYIAQQKHNDEVLKQKKGILLRFLVAKSGNNPDQSALVVRFILKAQEQDKTIVAVLGWTKTAQSVQVLPELSSVHMPVVSATATGDGLSALAPSYFFRVIPPNKMQSTLLVNYVKSHFAHSRLAAFYDSSDPFSKNFVEDDFQQEYYAAGYRFVGIVSNYIAGESDTALRRHVDAILASHPDAVLLETKTSADAGRFLKDLPAHSRLRIFGDASLYPVADAPHDEYPHTDSLSFASPAFPDEWGALGYGSKTPTFCTDYAAAFDPGYKPSSPSSCGVRYGFNRPDAYAMLSYDGMLALLEAINRAQKGHGGEKTQITADDVQKGLKNITPALPFQGVSGQIGFGSDGEPVEKEVVMLNVMAAPGKSLGLNLVDHTGCFLVHEPSSCKN